MDTLSETIKFTLKNAAKKLTGPKRRAFVAQVTLDFFQGNARKAERELGWSRSMVNKGLRELESGIICIDNYSARGNKKTEEKLPHLEKDIRELVDPHSQADSRVQSHFAYTRITAKAVRHALIEHKGYSDAQLPHENTIGHILNRFGYRLKRVQKTKPVKKIPEVDEIFHNVAAANRASDQNPASLRISIDTKAKLNIGAFSRHGKARDRVAPKALDHDMNPERKLVPFGILDVLSGSLDIIYGTSNETSDFIGDCLILWWEQHQHRYTHIHELVINLDNGPTIESHRTQFIRRITEFADQTGLRIRLIYYPPYHSKYNPIERCWGVLEEHWNGALLDSMDKAIKWAATMTWKGIKPIVHVIDALYNTGISLTKKAMAPYEERIKRAEHLPKWDITIEPCFG